METWTECVRREARRIEDRLEMAFEDGNNKYVFQFADMNAYSYGPCCPDFDLFVDVCTISGVGTTPEKPVWRWNQALGNSLDSEPRKTIPFGEEYYNAVYPQLYKITEDELRANNNKLIESFEGLNLLENIVEAEKGMTDLLKERIQTLKEIYVYPAIGVLIGVPVVAGLTAVISYYILG